MVKLTFSTEQEWHALRSNHIGGSEIAALFNYQPIYMPGRWALWQYKAGFADQPKLDSQLVKWGNRLEGPIAQGIAEDNGWTIRKGGYYQDDHCPHLGASLDYEIIDGHDQDGIGCLEIKNVNTFNFSKTWTDDEPPTHILLQLQHQLAATGYKWGVIAALKGGYEPHVFYYTRRETIIEKIRIAVKQFWQSLDEKTPPPPDNSPVNNDVLKQLFPQMNENELDLSNDNEMSALCANFLKYKEQEKQLQKRIDTIKFTILDRIGSHKKVVADGFHIDTTVIPQKPERIALPGEIISGRAESRRLRVKEIEV